MTTASPQAETAPSGEDSLIATKRETMAFQKHRRASRWMHWINFPLITIMVWSGLRIYWADLQDPFVVGVRDYELFEFFPALFNESLGLERRLARGIAFHFAFGWLFAINGVAYVLYSIFSGAWREMVPQRKAMSDSLKVVAHDLGLRRGKPLPPQGKYNAAQRITYSLVIFLGAIAVLTGLAIYKPTQLSPLTSSFGGYESSRTIHFFTTIAFMGFFGIHILQVIRAGFANFWSMVTGYELEPIDDPHGLAPKERPLSSDTEHSASADELDLVEIGNKE